MLSTGKNELPERRKVDSEKLLSDENKITFKLTITLKFTRVNSSSWTLSRETLQEVIEVFNDP